MLAAREKGVEVLGVLDRAQAAHDYSPHPALLAKGAKLHKVPVVQGFDKAGKLHHKDDGD